MHGQARIAVRAVGDPAAVVAGQDAREAPAVEQDEALPSLGEGLAHGVEQRAAEALVGTVHAGIQAAYRRGLRAVRARAQTQVPIAALAGLHQGLQRRCGGTENHRDGLDVTAHDREVAGVVAQAVLLLVGRVVFLVDDDQPEPRQRREQRRAGPEQEAPLPEAGVLPDPQPLACRQSRVQGRDLSGEASADPLDQLRSQRDLRDQDQDLPVACERVRGSLEVHLCLAAAGDPVQQEHGPLARVRGDRGDGLVLLGGQGDRRVAGRGPLACGLHGLEQAARGQAFELGPAQSEAGQVVQRVQRQRRSRAQQSVDDGLLARTQPRGRGRGLQAPEKLRRPGSGQRPAGAQCRGQGVQNDLADGVMVVACREPQQFQQRGREDRPGVEDSVQGANPRQVDLRRLVDREYDARLRAAPEGQTDALADGGLPSIGAGVVEQLVQRTVHGNADKGLGAHGGSLRHQGSPTGASDPFGLSTDSVDNSVDSVGELP
jgi:hypothetical protein